MGLSRITLRLARNEDYPDGDARQGYIVIAPLDADGKIDLEAWRAHRKVCTVERFHPEVEERADGWLSHHGSHWFFRYDEEEEGPDEDAFRLGDHVFKHGEYLTVTSHGETPLTYVVSEVYPL